MAKNKVLNITEIEDGLKKLISDRSSGEFITSFLGFYDIPKTSITRALKKFNDGEPFVIKNKLHYEEIEGDVVVAIDTIQHDIADQKSKPRYIMVKDFSDIAAIDTKTGETLNIPIAELPANADFFLAWNGIEKADYQAENPADRKAAERFAKLYDVVAKDNPDADEHAFNLFLIRVLFLLFAEDTGIMNKGSFTNVLKTRTAEDGSNFNSVIKDLFEVLDINQLARNGKEAWLLEFPYVNGKLFGEPHVDLVFSKVSRELLIEAGELLNWDEVNPDILGAMIQSVASAEDRHVAGMHYTSVPNIMKVIKPLFLDELNEAFESLKTRYEENELKDITEKTRKENKKVIIGELHALIDRISKIKFLDPASGSGNFLIIAYKEIRRLEIKILQMLEEIENDANMPLSSIHLGNFNGIELDDFAHEVAKLSLWIAEHQMNKELEEALPGTIAELLPLKDAGNIVCANSLRVDWDVVLSSTDNDEVFIFGNPPYIGSKKQKKEQKAELSSIFKGVKNSKNLDYISAWFLLASKYAARRNARVAFVSTNSITQGEQVYTLWTELFKLGIEIQFAYTSFKWNNSAKNNAGVTVVIIGLSVKNRTKEKKLFDSSGLKVVRNINPYLAEGPNILVSTQRKPISQLPNIMFGSMPNDGGNLLMTIEERAEMLVSYPEADKFIRKFIGADEFINGTFRYCLWITEEDVKEASKIAPISNRIQYTERYRLLSRREATRKLANKAYSFGEVRFFDEEAIIIPAVSSENRYYIPMGFSDSKTVLSNRVYEVYGADLATLGILMSRMHMVWVKAVGGRLETRYNYSAGLCYNTFPIHKISTQRRNEISRVMTEILDLREYQGGTLGDLYNDETMPESLRRKHKELDGIVERAYQQRPFDSDEERLSTLLKLYQEMTNND